MFMNAAREAAASGLDGRAVNEAASRTEATPHPSIASARLIAGAPFQWRCFLLAVSRGMILLPDPTRDHSLGSATVECACPSPRRSRWPRPGGPEAHPGSPRRSGVHSSARIAL